MLDVSNEILPNFYSIIPANLRYDNRLKATEKIFFSEISALTNLYGYCYASNKYFAKLYECDDRTIRRWIQTLDKFGYIKVEIIRNNNKEVLERRIYIRESILGGMDKNVHRGQGNSVRRSTDKNVLYNNIYINNIHTQAEEDSKKEYAEKVYLRESEYQDLVLEYGEFIASKCIVELNLYKKSKGVEYASDYDTIKRWVIDRVKEKNSKEAKQFDINKKNEQKSNYQNYEQRKYPEGFFDQFYANI
jgi:hypothetical protein